MRRIRCLIIAILIISLSGCLSAPETISDIRELPQDNAFYLEPSLVLVSGEDQQRMDANYNSLYFSPWHHKEPTTPPDWAMQQFRKFAGNPGYGENLRRRESSWYGSLLDNAKLANYPNAHVTAITVDNTNLRALPTRKPVFRSLGGYPFDRLQESYVAANTPLYVSHIAADKAWLFVETPYAAGWVASRDVAFTDDDFIKTWERGTYAVVIKDKAPLYDDKGQFLFKAALGSILPAVEESSNSIKVYVASADMNKNAFIRLIVVPKESTAMKPLKMTGLNMAKVANQLIGGAYGWGGNDEDRDCSAMVKDLFAPFGRWLSRNSVDQAQRDGLFIDLQNFTSEEKKRMIMERGVPYLTLLWIKGHIMLYVGKYRGQPVVFHNFWGIRTKDFLGQSSLKIVGHAAITTLHPGRELNPFTTQDRDLLSEIAGMTLLNQSGERESCLDY